MKVYVAGPMTGYVEHNFPAFRAAAERLRSLGYEVVSPAELDDPNLSHEELAAIPHEVYMKRDLAYLLGCDAIYLLPGWTYSKGAALEATVARGCGLLEVHDPDVEVWRTFEGEPLAEVEEDSAEDAEVIPFPEVDVVVDETLPPNTIRFETGTGHVDFEAQWPEEHRLVLVPKCEVFDQPLARGARCSELTCPQHGEGNRREAEAEMLDRIAAHSQPRHDSFRPGDSFPNVAYVRDMTGRTTADLAEVARQAFASEQFVRGTE